MTDSNDHNDPGSLWRRWEPHVHAPGTVLNDQFGGKDPWERYLKILEDRTPKIEALGVTDYYSLDLYERLVAEKNKGRLPLCRLLFPNIEMRLALGTVKGNWVNLHLLVSPETQGHVDNAKRFLNGLTFRAYEDKFHCTRADLIRLGCAAGATPDNEVAALKEGSIQFKVTFNELVDHYRSNAWARENILVAVSANDDGTGGLRDAADASLRQEVERFAHIVFASSPAQREFWLGLRKADAEELRRSYGGLKPCLHGSDAHQHKTTAAPDEDRFSWVKGNVSFDALRQCCIDPAGRAYVGTHPPTTATPSQVIHEVTINRADWAATPRLRLNPGLVAVIGSRGSGKTALADVIAAGCEALPSSENRLSFLHRAREHLGNASVTMAWGAGEPSTRPLDQTDDGDFESYPRARYLSQQFVEALCSADGMTDGLLREVQRVIFDAHALNDRDGAINFDDLLELRTSRFRQARAREESALAGISERIAIELEKRQLVPNFKSQVLEKTKLINQLTTDRSKLVTKGSEDRMLKLDELTNAAEKVRGYVRFYNLQEQQLLTLQDEVRDVRQTQAPENLRNTQSRHSATGIKGDDWNSFLMDFQGPVDKLLADSVTLSKKQSARWKGIVVSAPADPAESLIAADAVLAMQSLSVLEAEIKRLQLQVSADRATAERFAALSRRIVEETDALGRLNEKLEDAEGAKDRAEMLVAEREASYRRVFEAITSEQNVLSDLYAPIKARLDAASGTLQKMAFTVRRMVDSRDWAQRGEQLLDLRGGTFKGVGTIQKVAEQELFADWSTGDSQRVSDAMKAFRERHQEDLLKYAPVARTQQSEYRAWSKRFAQWLYGTDHVTVQYSVDYDGVDIRNLSPGTRGIVLLMLYLALDDADDRPLIIDQPEENLDPKSIYDELVGLFLTAKKRRQVIIVTHNANLVINTDADQIVIASAERRSADQLPAISYMSGGLEKLEIRKAVCDILEGGEAAFRERARRLRVRLER